MKGTVANKVWNYLPGMEMTEAGKESSKSIRYGIAILCILIAFLLRYSLNPVLGDRMPYASFAATAMLAAWLGRFASGLIALLGGMAVGYYFFVTPQWQAGPMKILDLTVFLSTVIPGVISIWVIELLHRSRSRTAAVAIDTRDYARQLEREIQERQVVEREVRCLQRITEAINEAPEIPVALNAVLKDVCECSDWAFGQVWIVNPEGTRLVCGRSAFLADPKLAPFRRLSEQLTFGPGEGTPGTAWKDKAVQWLPDLKSANGFTRRDAALELGIHSTGAFPVIANGDVFAVLEFFLLEEHERKDRSVRFISAVTIQLGGFIQRKLAEDRLRESERTMQTLARLSPVGIFRTDKEGNCLYVNQRWCEIAGIAAEKSFGLGWLRAVHPQDRQRVVDRWIKSCMDGNVFADEYRFCRQDGSLAWVVGSSAAERDQQGQVISYIGTITDITERKRTEDKLRESERRLAEAQRIARVGSWNWDVAANRVMWSDELYELVGMDRESFAGTYEAFLERVHPEDQETVRALVARSLFDGSLYDFEHRFVRGDGQVRFFHCRGRVEMNSSGQVISMAGAAQDVTERKEFELALEKAQQQLKKYALTLEQRVDERMAELQSSMKQMEGFCYSIAHDLRAPLRAMEGFAHAMIEDYGSKLDETGLEYAKRIIAASQRMDHLIQDLLAYGRLSHVDLPRQWLDLRKEVELIVMEYSDEIKHTGAILQMDGPLHRIWANTTALTQILGNLVSNALKFVNPDVPPHIRIWSQEDEQFVRVWVQDNGIGIAPEHHARIFRVFEKLHDPADYHGTGIGLAIASKAVERLNGRMGVESTPGKGSSFWFELPKPSEAPAKSEKAEISVQPQPLKEWCAIQVSNL